MFILKMKALKPRCLRYSSGKNTHTHRGSLFVKKNEKIQFMEIVIFNITDYLHGILTIIKPRKSVGKGYTCNTSVPARELSYLEYTQVEDFFCSSHSFAMNRQWGTCLVNYSSKKGSTMRIYSKWLAPGISLLDNTAVNAINWMVIQPYPSPSSIKWLSCSSPSFKSMDLN